MKFILFAFAVLLTGMCFAQGVPPEQKFPKTPLVKKYPTLPLQLPPMPEKITVLKDGTVQGLNNSLVYPETPQAKFLGRLPNGNIVFALPKDNMPCVVPNVNSSVLMPNVTAMPSIPYRYNGPGAIPNPSVPILLTKPTKKQSQ